MTSVQCITVDEAFSAAEFPALLAEYAAESAIDGLPAPAPSVERYRQVEASGVMHLLCSFTGGVITGFIVLLVSNIPHYNAVVATTESYFVGHAHRDTGAGLKLLRAAEAVATDQGAVGILVSTPVEGRLVKVLPKSGYTGSNMVFFRGLT